MQQQSLVVGKISIDNNGLEPVIKLNNIVMFNDKKNKKPLQISELKIGIDIINSLLKWRIMPSILTISGAKIKIYQNKKGEFYIYDITNSNLNDSSDHVFK